MKILMRCFMPISALLIIIFNLISCDNNQIPPGVTQTPADTSSAVPEHTFVVEQKDITQVYEAVGTIRPLTESIIESQVSGQVVSVLCAPGTFVKKGDLLIKLDARRLTSQLKQAKEGLEVAKNNLKQTLKGINEAEAGLDQTKAAYERTLTLFKSDIVPSQKLEIDKAAFLQAKARLEKSQEAEQSAKASVRQAEQVVQEARIAQDYAGIISPADGVVTQRQIEPGDLAVPGKPLLKIQTSGALRLEAHVREGLIGKIALGSQYPVKIETLERPISSTIEEIVPYADPATRTFLVKASLTDTPGIYPGIFGRLLIPVEIQSTLLIPADAVRRVGQLELVMLKKYDSWQSVYIKTGRQFDDKIEVLAGLGANETIGY